MQSPRVDKLIIPFKSTFLLTNEYGKQKNVVHRLIASLFFLSFTLQLRIFGELVYQTQRFLLY